MTFVNEKNLKKEALAVFKMVQIYMSDRKAKVGMTINSVAQDIAESGFGNINLRDEIYIQLCKQISDNPRRESLRRGWELLGEQTVRVKRGEWSQEKFVLFPLNHSL